jgi:methylglutaconyl-CoA hydratase
MSSSSLEVSCASDGVLTVTLARPGLRNAFDGRVIADLRSVLATEAAAPQVRCLVLRGQGPVFCAGGQVQWLRAARELSPEDNLAEVRELVRLLTEVNGLPVPVICGVQGAAIGGGVGLVSAADVAICTRETVFSISEARLGLVPSCIAPFVRAKIGDSWTRRFMLTGERFSASQALDLGLVHEVVPGPAELAEAVERVVQAVLSAAPMAVRATKRMLGELGAGSLGWAPGGGEAAAARAFAASRVAAEGQEGLAAFLEQREPAWRIRRG